jgi:hypothetical protein
MVMLPIRYRNVLDFLDQAIRCGLKTNFCYTTISSTWPLKILETLENSRDEDYLTEKLYQGLRAGSAPIYLGAPNVRDFLPHPDSALLIEDFDNIDALVDYVKRANADEQLYAKHMAWKSTKLSYQFMDRVAKKPMDSIFCRVCDVIATKYGDGVGPVPGGKGDGVILPWCIIQS